jgi:hypothetical protein
LNEIIEELENIDDESEVPDRIYIFPPENCYADFTDEDSGDENFVLPRNLPGMQLEATAEVSYDDSSSEESEDDVCHLLIWLNVDASILKKQMTEELISISPLILNKFWSANGMITAS